MTNSNVQSNLSRKSLGEFASSLGNAVNALVGNRQLLDEFSATAAHYDGLIDAIERAGWDLGRLERVKHAFDETAQQLLGELIESRPDMSKREERSFIEPFHAAIHQFARMSAKEKVAFKYEYNRFSDLQARSLQELAAVEA